MASPQTSIRKILKPKSVTQRVRENQPTVTAPIASSPMAEPRHVNAAEPQCANQTTPPAGEEIPAPEGIEIIRLILSTLNAQTTAYVELAGSTSIASSAVSLADLHGVSDVIKYLYSKLTTAIIDHLAAQSGIFLILSLPSSEFTIHNLRLVSAGLRQVLRLANNNFEIIGGSVTNVEVLEEMQCGLKGLKQQCLFGYAEHYMEMLRLLEEENKPVKREEERAGLVGPRRADFVSLFPSRRGMARLFCGEKDEE